MNQTWLTITGRIDRGHRVASGTTAETPYPRGTIAMQTPFFTARGLDLRGFYQGTLNISIHPRTFTMRQPAYTFRRIEWTMLHPPEDFSFSQCMVLANGTEYSGWIYYPHPETKLTHFQDPSIIEVIAPFIPGLGYGDRVAIAVNPAEVTVDEPGSRDEI